MTFLNYMLWSFTSSNTPVAVRVKFISSPISYTPTFTNNQLYDRMEMSLTNVIVSDSPSTMYEVRTDTVGTTATGKPLFVSVFANAKDGRMENHDGVNWIDNFIEFTNGRVENMEQFNGQTLIAMANINKAGLDMDEIMSIVKNDTVIRWLEVLDHLMFLGADVDRDLKYLRRYGDIMDDELCRMSGTMSGIDDTGALTFNTIANITHPISEIWADHWSLYDVFTMYSSIHWKTVRLMCSIDRGARLFASVLWRILRKKTTCHLPVKLIYYDENKTPIFWINTTNRWVRRIGH